MVMRKEVAMTIYPYILFNQSPEQLRRIGARGGRAYGRNRRARFSPLAVKPQEIVAAPPPVTTAARAIATLDAQFPWLRGAEQRERGSR